jgi:formate dehydrogenase subunit delta
MSPDKLIYQANQIATFFHSKPHAEGVAGVADHINKFWEPRMRRQFFEMIDAGGKGFDRLVLDAVAAVRPPPPEEKPAGAQKAGASGHH